jgi:hypothetical protein
LKFFGRFTAAFGELSWTNDIDGQQRRIPSGFQHNGNLWTARLRSGTFEGASISSELIGNRLSLKTLGSLKFSESDFRLLILPKVFGHLNMSFDPYRKWLGIPDNRRPPNFYELLGITVGERDADVIRSAIDQRRMYVRSKLGEGQDSHVKAILGLIEEATSTLLVPEFKHGYDRQLGIHLKKGGSRRSYVLPSWMESRVVRVYGGGSGIVGDLLGIVTILLAAFGLMAWWSFRLHDRTTEELQVQISEPIVPAQPAEPVAPKIADKPAPVPAETAEYKSEVKDSLDDFNKEKVAVELEQVNSKDKLATLRGTYLIKWKEETGNSGELEYEILPNLSVVRAGTPAAKLSLRNGQVWLDFDEKRRGSVQLTDITDESFSGFHTWEDGKQSTWKAKRKNLDRQTNASNSLPLEQNENLIGSTLFRSHRYKVFREAGLDWMTAKNRCEAMGGHLVTISDEQENQFMIALATKTLGDINNTGIWLGASDERNEGQWEWLDGTPFKYSNWNEGSPNGKDKENHLLLLLYFRGPQGKEVRGWADQPMAGKLHVIYFACEWDDLSESAITSNDRNANTQETEDKASYSIVGLWQSTDGTESKTFSSDGTFVEMNRAGKVFNSGKWQKDGRNIFQGKLKNGYSINIEVTTSAEAKFTVFNQQNSFVEKKQMIRVAPN